MPFRVSFSEEPVWSGEHWTAYLRRPGERLNSGSVSLYYTRHSPVGEGTTVLVNIFDHGGLSAICTDNREVARFVVDNIVKWEVAPFDREIPVLDAEVTRDGEVMTSPSWTIRLDERLVVVKWSKVNRPLVLESRRDCIDVRGVTSSLLFFTDQATIMLNGCAVDGEVFIRDDWKSSIGRSGSSSCFALAETIAGPLQEAVH